MNLLQEELKKIERLLNDSHGFEEEEIIKEYEKTIVSLTALLENYTNENIYSLLGACYALVGNHEKALEVLDSGIKAFDNVKQLWLSKGLIYNDVLKFNNKSIKCFSKALEIDDKYFDAYYERAITYDKIGYFQDAIEDFENALKYCNEQHKKVEIYYHLGDCNLKMQSNDNYYEAQHYFDLFLADKENINDSFCYFMVARSYYNSNYFQDAIMIIKKAMEVDYYPEQEVFLAEVYYYSKNYDDSLEIIDRLISNNTILHLYRGFIYKDLHNYECAIKDLLKFIDEYEYITDEYELAKCYYGLADCFFNLNMYDRSLEYTNLCLTKISWYKKAIDLRYAIIMIEMANDMHIDYTRSKLKNHFKATRKMLKKQMDR